MPIEFYLCTSSAQAVRSLNHRPSLRHQLVGQFEPGSRNSHPFNSIDFGGEMAASGFWIVSIALILLDRGIVGDSGPTSTFDCGKRLK